MARGPALSLSILEGQVAGGANTELLFHQLFNFYLASFLLFFSCIYFLQTKSGLLLLLFFFFLEETCNVFELFAINF